jgi:GAF domain-containing protein
MTVYADHDRVAALAGLGILDTAQTPEFDCLTSLAASVFDVPIALVSFVDLNRQWFKSRHGLDVSETPRAWAFCTYAIECEDLLVVEDATRDPRFAQNPLVTGAPGIRFYAGAPLRLAEGHALGTLCLIDTQTRRLDAKQKRELRHLARAAVTAIELHRRNQQLAQLADAFERCPRESAASRDYPLA